MPTLISGDHRFRTVVFSVKVVDMSVQNHNNMKKQIIVERECVCVEPVLWATYGYRVSFYNRRCIFLDEIRGNRYVDGA